MLKQTFGARRHPLGLEASHADSAESCRSVGRSTSSGWFPRTPLCVRLASVRTAEGRGLKEPGATGPKTRENGRTKGSSGAV